MFLIFTMEELDNRYKTQAEWTKELRNFVYTKIPHRNSYRILEVGCGTGTILQCVTNEFPGKIELLTGIDIDPAVLSWTAKKRGQPYIVGDGCSIPFSNDSFDLVFCHYLLLWLEAPEKVLLEMKRVASPNGIIAAFAEPCYAEMEASPNDLLKLTQNQRKHLIQTGIHPETGGNLRSLFLKAGFKYINAGKYYRNKTNRSYLLQEIEQMLVDTSEKEFALKNGVQYDYYVPTYFAYAEK